MVFLPLYFTVLNRIAPPALHPRASPLFMKITLPLLISAALCEYASAAAYSITSVISETKGTTATVTSSGNKNNTTTLTTGVVGQFLISDGTTTYGLQVSVSNPTGGLTTGTDSLMVARTVNSQGLTDTGTLSIYISPGDNATVPDANWSLDLRFSFFNVDGGNNFTTPFSPTLLLTSLDIDSSQRYYTDVNDFASNNLYPSTSVTNVSGGNIQAGYNGFTASTSSEFNDPRNAVSSQGKAGVTEFDVRVAHNNVALFMFEFRDPSQVVPEPSSLLLAAGGVIALGVRRRK